MANRNGSVVIATVHEKLQESRRPRCGLLAFSCLFPAAKISITERPHGAKLAAAGFLHDLTIQGTIEVSNALTMADKRTSYGTQNM